MGTMNLCLVVLLVSIAIAIVPHSCSSSSTDGGRDWARAYGAADSAFFPEDPQGDFASDDSRRLLFQYGFGYPYPRGLYLSYDALKKNSVACGSRGHSYYDCSKRRRANPYRRRCTAMTGCARFTD